MLEIVAIISAVSIIFSPGSTGTYGVNTIPDANVNKTEVFNYNPATYLQESILLSDGTADAQSDETVTTNEAQPADVAATVEEAGAVALSQETAQETTEVRTYYGECKLSGYCPCKKCTGKSKSSPGYGITASGEKAVEGVTVAMSGVPFGTHIYIEGLGERIVQDRGVGDNKIDVFLNNHSDCFLAKYNCTAKVWIIENK